MNHPLGTNMFQLHMFFSTVLKVSSEIPEKALFGGVDHA